MKGQGKESGRIVESVQKALEILDCFQSAPSLSLKELSNATRLYKSRVIRMAGTMSVAGYLVYDPNLKVYSLSPKMLVLGKSYEKNNTLISLARPILQELARLTGESATLFVINGLQRLCVAREEGSHNLRYSICEGQRLELHIGAAGKVLLSFCPQELRQKILKKSLLKRLTPNTTVDPKRIHLELEEIRKKGYALSIGERSSDVASLAVPVFNSERKICAAIGIAGPITRFSIDHNGKNLKLLLEAAQRVSRGLGFED